MKYARAVWGRRGRLTAHSRVIANAVTAYAAVFLSLAVVLFVMLAFSSLFRPNLSLREEVGSVLGTTAFFTFIPTIILSVFWGPAPLLLTYLAPASLRATTATYRRARANAKLETELRQRNESAEQHARRQQLQETFIAVAEELAQAQGQNVLKATVSAHEALDLLTSRS